MNKAESINQFMKEHIPAIMKSKNVDYEDAITGFLNAVTISFMRNENDVDVLDLAIAFTLAEKEWNPIINIKVFHDIYYSPYYKSVNADFKLLPSSMGSKEERGLALAERYMDRFYKPGHEDFDTFLWRCLCIGYMPNADYLRLSEEERKAKFTKEVDWVEFYELDSMTKEDIQTAIHLTGVDFDDKEIPIASEAEADNGKAPKRA